MRFSTVATILLALIVGRCAIAKELSELKVLYIGSERTDQFMPFLKRHVAQAESRERKGFNPADAAAFDVVVLDWPQVVTEISNHQLGSCIGQRDAWKKPTVLIGSAG